MSQLYCIWTYEYIILHQLYIIHRCYDEVCLIIFQLWHTSKIIQIPTWCQTLATTSWPPLPHHLQVLLSLHPQPGATQKSAPLTHLLPYQLFMELLMLLILDATNYTNLKDPERVVTRRRDINRTIHLIFSNCFSTSSTMPSSSMKFSGGVWIFKGPCFKNRPGKTGPLVGQDETKLENMMKA